MKSKQKQTPTEIIDNQRQALHHETVQTLALESTEQKLSRWQRLRRAWRG